MSETLPSQLMGASLPNSVEAECSVLGAMLQDSGAVLQAAEHLRADDFYQPAHKEIFNAMMALHQERSPIDLITLDTELSRRGTLEGVGGTVYLVELMQRTPITSNVKAYIVIVQEKSTLRKLIEACQEISRDCYTQQLPMQEILNRAERAVFDIVMKRATGDTLVHIRDVLYQTYAVVEQLSKLKGRIAGIPTGFTDLDNCLTGMHGGELILIGARPSMGKTSFAVNIATYAALKAQKHVAVFSLEMPREQIALRMLCGDARVDMQKVRKGALSSEDWMKLAASIGELAKTEIYIDDTAGITPSQLRSRCRRLMMDKGLDLVVLDYLGLMQTDRRSENRQLEVSEISRQLKAIALELKVPLVACAQLSRASTQRTDKRPVLSDLRDSGSIEQDADVVLFLHREDYYNKETAEKNVGEVIVAKQRNGPLENIKLAWLSECTSYANLVKSDSGAPF